MPPHQSQPSNAVEIILTGATCVKIGFSSYFSVSFSTFTEFYENQQKDSLERVPRATNLTGAFDSDFSAATSVTRRCKTDWPSTTGFRSGPF